MCSHGWSRGVSAGGAERCSQADIARPGALPISSCALPVVEGTPPEELGCFRERRTCVERPCISQDLSGLIEIDGDNFAFADLAEEDAVPRRLVRIDEDNMVWGICREEVAGDARGPGLPCAGCASVRGAIEDVGDPARLSFVLPLIKDAAHFVLLFYQCLVYVFCSSAHRPWWCLVAVVLAGLHCRRLRECKAVSLGAACALALSDETLPAAILVAHVVAAVLVPIFRPKKKEQSNLAAYNAARRGGAAITSFSTTGAGRAGASQG